MTHSFDGYNHVIRLFRGERLSEALEQFFAETKIEGAWVNGLGGCTEATLSFFNLQTKEYQWQMFTNTMEVLSITGNLALDETGKVMPHLHAVLGDEHYQTVGGHLKDLVVGATLELFIHKAYQPLRRQRDEGTGLQLLDLQ